MKSHYQHLESFFLMLKLCVVIKHIQFIDTLCGFVTGINFNNMDFIKFKIKQLICI